MADGDVDSCESMTRLNSDTIILKHSQSPTFDEDQADEEIPEVSIKTVPAVKKRGREPVLKIRELPKNPVTKQNLKISPIVASPTLSPEAKRQKDDDVLFDDFWCDIKDNQLRMEKIICSQIDIREMYQTLLRFKSVIPCPRPLLFVGDNSKTAKTSERCRWGDTQLVEDRKAAVNSLFTRRRSLKLNAETLHLAAGLLDQCLEKLLVDKKVINDLAAVALLVASKVEEVNYLSVSSIIDSGLIEKQSFSMVCVLERLMLSTLSFRVTFPTPLTFATYLLVHLNASQIVIHLTHYLLELSVLYVHNRFTSSDVVAQAAVSLAFGILCVTNQNSHKSLVDAESRLQDFCETSATSVANREVMIVIADLFLVAPAEKHAVFLEYATSRRDSVALRPIDVHLQNALKLE